MSARRTGATLFVGVVVGSLALTGCGAGQMSSTALQVAAVDGTNTAYGPIVVRNAVIAYPEDAEPTGEAVFRAGGSAPLEMIIVNQLAEADRLVSVTSEFASSVEVTGQTEIPGGRMLVVSPESGSEAGAATTTPSASPSATPSAAPSATPTTTPSSEPGSGAQIVLTGLRGDLRAGETYPIVFTFERAGAITVDTPIGPPTAEREEPEGEGGH